MVGHVIQDTSIRKGAKVSTISIGKNCFTSVPKKQKVNTVSPSIYEAVGVNEVSPQLLCTREFLHTQLFEVE